MSTLSLSLSLSKTTPTIDLLLSIHESTRQNFNASSATTKSHSYNNLTRSFLLQGVSADLEAY
jgi:hypothetical protein